MAALFTLVKLQNYLAADLKQVDQMIADLVVSDYPIINEVTQYVIASGGKKVRPIISCLIAHALNVEQDFCRLAAITELIHTATLLHDDVIDESMLRRNKATVNHKYDNPTAILVGDFLHTRAFQLLAAWDNMPLLKIYIDAINLISQGEVLQLSKLGNEHQTIEDYFEIIYNKTGCLFQACAKGTALLKDNATPELLEQASNYGKHLGIAFQIIDDYLDYKDSDSWTKQAGDDLAQGKVTLALLHLQQHGNSEDQQLIKDIINLKIERSQLAHVVARLEQQGSLQYCKDLAEQQVNLAKQQLTSWPETQAKQYLLQLADLLLKRDK